MYTSNSRSETIADTTDSRPDIPTDAVVLGIDRQGATHLFSRGTETVILVATTDLIERFDLSNHSLASWVTITAQECGWRDLRDAEMFVEILADTVGAH